ncbi:hypothetical protein EV44_g3338 [Erysiphe necator]|uniref:Uncharacterized protein n=1 Tax=Uncinula necator TaxID=52586 RepID=A0A0B1P1V9_UNCNE|nr:hypothetical protein EV44_g3338 [Erysiphe necator]
MTASYSKLKLTSNSRLPHIAESQIQYDFPNTMKETDEAWVTVKWIGLSHHIKWDQGEILLPKMGLSSPAKAGLVFQHDA